jgi:hypothetical protein
VSWSRTAEGKTASKRARARRPRQTSPFRKCSPGDTSDADVAEAELDYLRKEIFQREDGQIAVRAITSLDRFSSRI